MDSIGVVYAKVPGKDVAALEAALKRAAQGKWPFLGVVAFDPEAHAFALVDRWGKSDNMPHWAEWLDMARAQELLALSREVGEVVAFYTIDEGDTLGLYGAFRDGALVRELQWGDAHWEKARGAPQAWEAPLGRIEPGADAPPPERLAVHIREALRAPAYGVMPWPRRRDVLKG